MDYTPHLGAPSTGVVITGGASGIGLASAHALGAVGRPVALWDIQEERAREAATEIAAAYGITAIGIGCDVRDPAALSTAAIQSRAGLPSIGGLIHGAGMVDTDSIDGLTVESWDSHMNTHLRPLALLAQQFLPDLKRHSGSAIVAVASINATLGNAINPIYSAAKGGMLSLVRSLADRLARDGIRINSISPGVIHTPIIQPSVDALGSDIFTRRILLNRLGRPDEIGRMIRFLLSEEASYITAAEFIVDGGNVSSQRA